MIKPVPITTNFSAVEIMEICPACKVLTMCLWVRPKAKVFGHVICSTCGVATKVKGDEAIRDHTYAGNVSTR